MSENLVLVGEIPAAHGDFQSNLFRGEAGTTLGNPYLGAEFHLPESPLFLELGFRLPIVPDDKVVASAVGLSSDLDRAEAFVPDIFPVFAALNYETTNASNILVRVRAGSVFLFNSGNVLGSSEGDVIFNYSLQTGYAGQQLNVIVGLTGRYFATLPDVVLEERNLLQFGATITVPLRNVLPGVHLKLPLDESAAEIFDYVVGLNFGINFR